MALNKVEICGVETSTLPVLSHDHMRTLMARAHEGAAEARAINVSAFARKLALGVEKNEEKIDTILKNSLKGWQLSRISNVAHAILQIALYEMLYEDSVPLRVSINEAVELSKKYGDADDAKFVNGVLATVNREMERTDG